MMIRRLVLPLVALVCFASSLGAADSDADQPQPNIILFLVDDLGWQDTSVPFHDRITDLNRLYRTPNMQRLAKSGVTFTQAYAYSVCSPTRVSLMTGLSAPRHRVTNWTLRKNTSTDGKHPRLSFPAWNVNGLSPDPGVERSIHARALPDLLREVGYRTIHVGKAHFGAIGTPAADPLQIGFEVNIGGHAAGAPASYSGMQGFSRPDDKANVWNVPGLESYHGKDIYLTEALTREAIKEIDRAIDQERPFFLYMAHYAVHTPIELDARFEINYPGLHPIEQAYATMIEGMDRSLGDLLDLIQSRQVDDQTVVLFMSDNGGLSAVARGGAPHRHNLPLSSGKGSAHEGGTRVPMIARWPGVTRAGTRCHEPVIVEDFFPTILEMAGIDRPPRAGKQMSTSHEDDRRPINLRGIDGVSFAPLLRNEAPRESDRALIWHYPNVWGPRGPGIGASSSIRQGDWKLIYYHDPHRQPRFELFQLHEDLGEKNNLSDRHPEMVLRLAERLQLELIACGAQMPIVKQTGKPVPFPADARRAQ